MTDEMVYVPEVQVWLCKWCKRWMVQIDVRDVDGEPLQCLMVMQCPECMQAVGVQGVQAEITI